MKIRFLDEEYNKVLSTVHGDRRGIYFAHYRAIPREQWTPWQEARYKELRKQYYGKGE